MIHAVLGLRMWAIFSHLQLQGTIVTWMVIMLHCKNVSGSHCCYSYASRNSPIISVDTSWGKPERAVGCHMGFDCCCLSFLSWPMRDNNGAASLGLGQGLVVKWHHPTSGNQNWADKVTTFFTDSNQTSGNAETGTLSELYNGRFIVSCKWVAGGLRLNCLACCFTK